MILLKWSIEFRKKEQNQKEKQGWSMFRLKSIGTARAFYSTDEQI